jgi:hypothetical protein
VRAGEESGLRARVVPVALVQEGFGLAIIHSAQDQHAILDGLKRLQNVRELE